MLMRLRSDKYQGYKTLKIFCYVIFYIGFNHVAILEYGIAHFEFGYHLSVRYPLLDLLMGVLVYVFGSHIAPVGTAGTALSLVNMAAYLSNVVFIQLVGKILDMKWQGGMAGGIRVFTLHNFQVALCLVPIGYFLALIIGFLLKKLVKLPLFES